MHGSSQMNGQPSQGLSIDNNHGSQPPSLKSQKAAKERKVSRRGTAFSKEEDLVVCSAFLNINKDSIIGGYYKSMHGFFNEHKPEGSNRSQIAVQHRWAVIQKAMNKFCQHKAAIDRLNESGENEQDRIDDAVAAYERTERFTFMHCWRKLHNEAKWKNKFLELNNSTSIDGMSSPPTQGHAEPGNENIDTSWPEGRDSAKRRRSKSFTETSSSSTAVEVLQQLQEKSEKTEQKQDQQMVEIPSRKDDGHVAESEEILGEDQWPYGYSAALQSPDDPPDPQFNMHGSSQMNGQPSQGFSIDNNHGSQPPSLKSQKAANERKVSRRGTAFSKEEDLVICSAFLNIRKDSFTGGYYKRMHDFFNEYKPEGSNRSQIAVQHRWAVIQKAMNKFCLHKAAIDRLNESGKNEQDRIDDAVAAYERTERFTIMHCWKKLHNEGKWNIKFHELNYSTTIDGMSSPPTQGHAEPGNENIETSQPEGRDSAKRCRSQSFTEASSSSTAVQVLQRLQEKSEKTEQKQDQQLAEILSRKDDGRVAESEEILGADQWPYGYSAALQSPDDPPYPQFNMHGSSQISCPPMNGQPSQGFSIDDNHGSQPPSLKSQKAAKERKVSRRGTAFSKEEDLVVCSAFLNISKDPIIGVNQTSGGYYKRMHDFFNEHKPEGSNRSQIAVQHRWAVIQKAMNKFCRHKAAIDRLNESGENEQDRIDDTVAAYERTERFTIMHCWRKLHNEAKWKNKFLELNNSTTIDGISPPTQGHAEPGNENIETSQPEGRDSAKRRRSKSFTEASSSSTAVEVLQQLQEKSEKTKQKQDKQMSEILSRKDEKIKIQRELFNLQKKHMKMTLLQQKKENKIREKESEAQLIIAESSIMSVDIEKVPPHLKNYYIGMQRKIMERRGFVSPSNNED